MNHQRKSILLRVYRIIEIRDEVQSQWSVLEDVERTRFRCHGSVSGSNSIKATYDSIDNWNALNLLRSLTESSEDYEQFWPSGDSIDAAITKSELKMQEIWSRAEQMEAQTENPSQELANLPVEDNTPDSEGEQQSSEEKVYGVIRVAEPDECPSYEERKREEEEIWAYAGGLKLRWKLVEPTPSGRQCEVLTFSGSAEIIAGRSSVYLPTNPS